jgi:hypothetical protein
MAQLSGMDVDAMEIIVRSLEVQLGTIDGVDRSVRSACGAFHANWLGPACGHLVSEVTHAHLPALSTFRQELHRLLQELRRNIDEQVRHSSRLSPSAGSGTSGGGAVAAAVLGIGTTGVTSQLWLKRAKYLTTPVDLAERAARGSNVTGRYTNTWRGVLAAERKLTGEDHFMRYKSSPFLHWVAKPSQKVDHFLANPEIKPLTHVVAPLEKGLQHGIDKVGKVGGLIDAGVHLATVGEDVAAGNGGRALNDGVTVVADVLKSSKNPVSYLAGFDVSLIQKDVELAQQVHWGDGLPNPLSGNNWSTIYAPEVKALPGQFFSSVWSCF